MAVAAGCCFLLRRPAVEPVAVAATPLAAGSFVLKAKGVSRHIFGSSNHEKAPPERAPGPLLVPYFLARTKCLLWPRRSMRRSTSEPAAPRCRKRDRLYRRPSQEKATASGTGHLTRSRPQDSASSAAAPQWEPRKLSTVCNRRARYLL